MSHIVTIQTEIRDAAAVRAACQRLNLAAPVDGTHRLFTSQATGLCVQLPGWRWPTVCQLSTGRIQFDHYHGRWGDPAELDRFKQAYAVERAKAEARRRGHQVQETALSDGSIKLVIGIAGGAA